METKNERRADVMCLTIRYQDGTEEHIGMDEVRVGSIIKSTTMDSKEGKDRQEWDTVEIHLSGPKRPVRKAEE